MSALDGRYPLELFEGHLIVNIDGQKALVDTGSPLTLGNGENCQIGGRSFHTHKGLANVTVESISALVGCPFEILLGMDVMAEFDVTFSLQNNLATLGDAVEMNDEVVPLSSFVGIPTVPMLVNGKSINMIFDTGAPTSYLVKELMDSSEFVEYRSDFIPGQGTFECAVKRVPGEFAGRSQIFEMGELNAKLISMLGASGAAGIFGSAVLAMADVTMSMSRRALSVSWY